LKGSRELEDLQAASLAREKERKRIDERDANEIEGTKTHVVLSTVNSLPVKPTTSNSLPFRRSLRVLLERRDMHRDPDESVETENEVDSARKSVEVGFQTREEGGRKSDEVSVLELCEGTEGRDDGQRQKTKDERLDLEVKEDEPSRISANAYVTTWFHLPSATGPQLPAATKRTGRRRRRKVRRARDANERRRTHVSLLEEPGRNEGQETPESALHKHTQPSEMKTHCRICSSSDSSFLLCEPRRPGLISFARDLSSFELNKRRKDSPELHQAS